MITEAQNEIIKQIDIGGISEALGKMGFYFRAEEEKDGDRIFEFFALGKPKILLVITGEQE